VKIESPPGTSWDIYQCQNCSVQFIAQEPTSKQLDQLYDQLYSQNAEQVKRLHNLNYGKLTFRRQWYIIRNLAHSKHGRILDFGCAGGHFLNNVSQKWDKYGIELAANAREIATQKGIKTFATLEEAAFPDDFFDVITMFAVIEHLPEPKKIVKELSRVLKKGGLFVIMTGDISSLKARIQAERWHLYTPPGHIYYFTARSLDMMMESLGFNKIKTLYTDGMMTQVPFLPFNAILRFGLLTMESIPWLNSQPIFDLE